MSLKPIFSSIMNSILDSFISEAFRIKMTNKHNFTVKILHFKKNKVYINEIEVAEGTKAIDIIESFDRDIFMQIKE